MPDSIESAAEQRVVVNGVGLAYFEWGSEHRGTGPTILLVHATGFHAHIWDQIVRRLPGYHIVTLDQRGHGHSDKRIIHNWYEFVADLVAFVDALDLEALVGVGHSMGAHALIGAAAERPARFRRLVAIDPVIAPEAVYHSTTAVTPGGGAARRKNEFASPEEMVERLSGKGSFGRFDPATLRDYCTYGLVPNEAADGFVLACPPEVEASVYATNWSNTTIYEAVRALDIPVLILRAKQPPPDGVPMQSGASPTWPGLVHEFRHGREIYYPDRTHFIPMEIPDEVAALIRAEAAGAGYVSDPSLGA
jgi:lipase